MRGMQFVLALFAAASSLVFLASGMVPTPEPGWNPIEAQSAALSRAANQPATADAVLDITLAVSKWQRLKITRGAGDAPSATMEPRGAQVSLLAFASTSTTRQDCFGPDNNVPVFASTIGGGGSSDCSTTSAPAQQECSAKDSAVGGSCSVDQESPENFCSAGDALSAECSVFNNTGGIATCSVIDLVGTDMSCSTSGGNDYYCSATGGSDQNDGEQTCSTGELGGVGGGGQIGSECSALGGQGDGNTCSVFGGGGATGNQCSSDDSNGGNQFCSVSTSDGNPDFCSIATNQTNVACTAFGNVGQSTCSVAEGSNGACSVLGQQYNGGICKQ